MSENTLAPIQKEVPKPDWFMSDISGRLPEASDKLSEFGLEVADFEILKSEQYWGLDEVKGFFSGDQTLFEKNYAQSLANYNKGAHSDFMTKNFITQGRTQAEINAGVHTPKPQVTRMNPDLWGRTYNSMQTLRGGFSEKRRGWREFASQTGVRQLDGTYAPVKGYDGLIKFATEEDGSISVDEKGRPFMLPVGEDEELAGHEEIHNPMSEWMGYYGHDYSASQILSSIPKNALNFVSNTIDALAEYPKAIMALQGLDNSEFYKDVVGAENWAKSFRVPQTERGQESFFSLEGLTDLAQQVVYQLGSMVATGGSIGALTGSAKLGSMGGKLFMTGIAAGDIAQTARDAGLSNKEAAVLLGLTSAIYYPLMGLSEAAVGSLNLQSSKASMTATVGELVNVVKSKNPGTWKSVFLNARSNAKDMLYKGTVAGEGNALVGSAFGAATEAVEETAEQVVDLGIRNLYNLFNDNVDESSPVSQWLGTNKEDVFYFDWVKEVQLLGFSAFGGAIGGAIANRLFRSMGMKNPSLQRGVFDMVMDGKGDILRRTAKQLHAEERLGEAWINEEGEVIQNVGEISQNDAALNVIEGYIDWIEQTRDSQEIAELIPNNEQKLFAIRHLFSNIDTGEQNDLINSLPASSLGKDASNLARSITELNVKITEKQTSENSDPELIKDLQEEKDLKQERLRSIVNGNSVADYVAEGIYSLNSIAKTNFDFSGRVLKGKQFVHLSKMHASTLNNLNEQHLEDVNAFNERNKDITLENAPSAVRGEVKDALIADAQKNYVEAFDKVEGVITPEDDFDTELFRKQAGNPDVSIEALNEAFGDFILNNSRRSDPRFAEILKAREDLIKAREIDVEEEPPTPVITEPLMTMIRRTAGEDGSLIVPIRTLIAKKLEDEKNAEKSAISGGISTYVGTDRLNEIKDSIQVRQSQIKSLVEIEPLTTPIYERLGQIPLPSIDGDTANGLLGTLEGQLKDVNDLIRVADNNEKNQEVVIKQKTINKLQKELDIVAKIAEIAAGPTTKLKEIINLHTKGMAEALSSGNIDEFFSFQRQMESDIFDNFSDKQVSLLELLTPKGDVNAQLISSGALDAEIARYNYLRRVTSLRANDFWNAYSSAIENIKVNKEGETFMPSYEQVLIVKQAVQSLMGNKYGPPWMRIHDFRVSHNNSVLVRGDAGTGKTKQALPLIVATFQKLPSMGKVFVTSKHLGEDMSKVENITNAIKNYFVDDAINFNNSNQEILDFLDSDDIIDTNLIVYDEATLIKSDDLQKIQTKLDVINEGRAEAGEIQLKIMYAVDLKQNSIDVESQKNLAKSGQEAPARGFDDKVVHLIDKTDELSYSFRSQNMPLKMINDYLGEIQNIKGEPTEARKFEYRGGKGVNVINDYDSFVSHARNIIDGFSKKGLLSNVVYITDRDLSELDPKIKGFPQLQVVSPIQSQGLEWNTVILDLKTDTPFGETTNKVIKRAYYTGSTRAENYLITNINPSARMTSGEGTIRIFQPLIAEDNTLENHIDSVSTILGNASGQNFSMKQVAPDPDAKGTEPRIKQAPEDTTAREVQDIIETLSDRAWMTASTFFTPVLKGDESALENALETKRQVLYNPSPSHTYNLVVAQNGSPEYTTAIGRNSNYEGDLALYIEADTGSGYEVFAVLPSLTPENLVKLREIVGNQDVVKIKFDSLAMSPMRAKGPIIINGKKSDNAIQTTFAKVKADSQPGMTFGTPRIVMEQVTLNDKTQHRPTDIVIPVTFKTMTKEELDKVSNEAKGVPTDVTFLKVDKGRIPFENFIEELNERYYNSETGFNWKDDGFKAYYYSFWNHYTKQTTEKGEKVNTLANIFTKLSNEVEDDIAYKRFLAHYGAVSLSTETTTSADAKTEKAKNIVTNKKTLAGKKVSKARYFIADYVNVKNQLGTQLFAPIDSFTEEFYERAIESLKGYNDSYSKNAGSFKDGLLFVPSLGRSQLRGAQGSWHAKAWDLDSDNDNFLRMKGTVGLPHPQIQLENLINSIGVAATVNTDSFASETGNTDKASIDTKANDAQPEYSGENVVLRDSIIKKENTLIDFYTYRYNRRPERMISAINKFRSGIFNEIFDFTNGTIHSVNTAVLAYKTKINNTASIALEAGMTTENMMKIVDEDSTKADLADALAINSSLDFLLDFFFPAIKFKNGTFNLGITLLKQEGYYHNESIDALYEGMNEMIATQLLNTPLLNFKNNIHEVQTDENGNNIYITRDDLEGLIEASNDSASNEEFIESLKVSDDPVLKSIYVRFLSPSVTSVKMSSGDAGSNTIRSMSQWNHLDAQNIVTSLLSFIHSGDIFSLASVTLTDGVFSYKGLPISAFGRPNIVKQTSFVALLSKAHSISDQVIVHDNRVVIEGNSYYKSSSSNPSESKILDGMEAIGLGMFGKKSIEHLYTHPELMNIKMDDAEKQKQAIRNELMDEVIIPMSREIQNGDGANFTQYINRLGNRVFTPVIKAFNINYQLRQKNMSGNMSGRIRKSAPAMRFNNRLVKAAQESTLHSDNLFMNKTYQMHDMFLKEGFKKIEGGNLTTRSSNAASPAETADLDILYGFHKVLTQTDGAMAPFPIQIFSDSPTNVNMIVRTDKGFFRDPKTIYEDLFKARANYFRKLEQEIISIYNETFEKKFSGLRQIRNFLAKEGTTVSQLEKKKGFIKGLMYNDKPRKGTNAELKLGLIEDVEFYTGNNSNEFLGKMKNKYDNLKRLADSSIAPSGKSLTERLAIGDESGESVLKAFHANWVAISTQYLDLMVGSRHQYESDTQTLQYLDEVKRSQSETSNRTLFIHRNASWDARYETGQPLTEAELNEGKKLPKTIKVAYVHDIKDDVWLSTKDAVLKQEIYDGATFVLPLMRSMESASLGGNFGIDTPPVMKNVTTSQNEALGVKGYVKHAEFLITPEIMRNGTPRVLGMVKNMLNQPLHRTYGDGKIKTAWDALISQGVSEDLSNITQEHFDQLLNTLVTWGDQDTPIMEIIPSTAIKTGRGATNDINGSNWVAEDLDISNKGVQLDASKDAGKEHTIKVLTQIVNASVINWKNPNEVNMVMGSLARYTENILTTHKKNSNFKNTLRGWVNKGLERSSNLSYQHLLANKVKHYSFDNPQIIESVFITLGNVLSQGKTAGTDSDLGAAIMPLFNGNHYIVHPMKGLVNIVDVNRDGVIIPMLKSAMQEGDIIVNERSELKWNDPVKETEQGFVRFSEALAQAESKAGRDALRAELDQGLWSGGEAEILLPADMQNSFFMKERAEELGRPIQVTDITPNYLETKLAEKNPKNKTPEQLSGDAMLMYAAYKLRLSGLTTRIPATGKHSAVNTTIVGFMHESKNAVFVPIELLKVQGADQDIDKGEHLTYEVVQGIVPFTNSDFTDVLKGADYKQMLEEELGMPVELFDTTDANFTKNDRLMRAALRNNVVKALRNISASPQNTLEMNTTVDDALDELRGFAEEAKSKMNLSRDDYESHAIIRADNQAGKQLVSRFANALKAYQVMYGTVRNDANPPDSIDSFAGLYDSDNEIWVRFAALINAATDNSKEQILGALGINVDNANMVSYMVATGKEWQDIIDFFENESNAEQLKKYYDSQRYDSGNRSFDVSNWAKTNPELYETFKKGEEFGLFSQSIINRELPSGSFKMFNFHNRIEDFVVRNTTLTSFNFARFADPLQTGYRDNMIARYEEAISNNPTGMATNILYALGKSTHISAYNGVYSFAEQTMQAESKIYAATSKIASAITSKGKNKGFISKNKFKDIMDFTYGSAIHEFLNVNNVEEYGFELGTPTGRTEFVQWFNTTWRNDVKVKYGENKFTEMLNSYEELKYGKAKPVKAFRTRIHDMLQMDEEVALEMKANFDELSKEDRGTLALYSLIVDKGRIIKGSFGSLFDPTESYISKFNSFLAGKVIINTGVEEYNAYDDNSIFTDNPDLYHNAIPYGNVGEKTAAKEEEAAEIGRLSRINSKGKVSESIVDTLNSALPLRIKIPRNATLNTEVSVFSNREKIGRPRRMTLKELPQFYADTKNIQTDKFTGDLMKYMGIVFDNKNQPSNEESQERENNCLWTITSVPF
jgi:hypothetical protein